MRAKTRAVAAAAGAALVVVPLTGAAAAALVTAEDSGATSTVDASARIDLSNDISDVPEVTSTQEADAFTIDSTDVTVTAPPPPPPPEPEPEPEPVQQVTEPAPAAPEPAPAPATEVSNTTEVEAPAPAPAPEPPANVGAAISGSAVISVASQYVGTPYVYGGSTPAGFDCSGFVSYVYGQLGISLPRSSGAYWGIGTRVSNPQPGDIIVSPGHVAIYAGPNLQIDAPRPGKTVQFRPIWQANPTYIRIT